MLVGKAADVGGLLYMCRHLMQAPEFQLNCRRASAAAIEAHASAAPQVHPEAAAL